LTDDDLTTGALFLGGGVAGDALGRFALARWLDDRTPTTTIPGGNPWRLATL
jgi:hypothetical protein